MPQSFGQAALKALGLFIAAAICACGWDLGQIIFHAIH